MAIRVSSGRRTPHYTRLMIFVDGTNFLVEFSKELDIQFRADRPPLYALELSDDLIRRASDLCKRGSSDFITIRKFWFASYAGNEEDYKKLRKALRDIDFEPILFKKDRGKPEKGVDIALTKEMLVNAFNGNFDVAILFAGDEDYVGLVNEVKRYGPIVNGAFFMHGLSDNLLYAFDHFQSVSKDLFPEDSLDKSITKLLEEIKAKPVSKK
jgi:uncharacterized LabA/DUF88 family protein